LGVAGALMPLLLFSVQEQTAILIDRMAENGDTNSSRRHCIA